MLQSDFFAYCTSLPVLELKAVGELSSVRHYAEGEVVYSAGEESKELFIINRGLVELTSEPALPGDSIVLSRGDIFGETGAFIRMPRNQTARASASLSVQCFASKDFPELLRRVPSFFLFVCEKMGRRLFQTRTGGLSSEGGCELAGSLANFDLITIYQTIVRSLRTGALLISDERGETVSEFYFENGTPRWGRFQHLLGEEAFWQLFIQPRKAWSFSFSKELPTNLDWTEQKIITASADEMLIQAVQMRDEFESLRKSMSDDSALLKRQQLNFVWMDSDLEELRSVAEEIWQIAYNQPMSLVDLCQRCNACALKVYLAVAGMLQAGLFALVPTEEADAGSGKGSGAASSSASAKTNQISAKPHESTPANPDLTAAQRIPSVGSGPPEMKGIPLLATVIPKLPANGSETVDPSDRRAVLTSKVEAAREQLKSWFDSRQLKNWFDY